MSLWDWLIIIVPVVFVLSMGIYSRRYVRGVADFLSAGRLCGRYVICVADVANALSIMGLIAYVEVHYKTGFALAFWNYLTIPVTVFMGLTGYCFYRWRETKAMSLGQFLEMRYNRPFRIVAASLRSISEMLANMIMPAIGARFFIYFLGLPFYINIFGRQVPTFMLLTLLILTMAISIICMGGTLALVITDTIQGMFCYPLLVLFVIFILCKFSWSNEIVPVMIDRVQGESFLNPNDIENMRDFNLFQVGVGIFALILQRASWIGAGNSSAAKTAHEQKMANLLGQWRGALSTMFYLLIAITIIVLLNHKDFAPMAKTVRDNITLRVTEDIVKDKEIRSEIVAATKKIEEQRHKIGIDPPLSQKHNLDTTYLDVVHQKLVDGKKAALQRDNPGVQPSRNDLIEAEASGNALFQQFRTLFHQMMMAITMRNLLPPGMLGLFCLLLVMAMISTDDTRIYSASLTIAQDVILPLRKTPFTPKQHLWMIRIVAICVGIFFFFGSFFMSQLDYINMYISLMILMWTGGAGPIMIFGLYSRFGTTAGAFASLISGIVLGLGSVILQRNWADYIYPWLEKAHLVEPVGNFLATVSGPFNPIIVWEMNPVKCPINSYEFYFMIMCFTLIMYVVVSLLTCRKPFNLERLLHRGKYAVDGEVKQTMKWSFRNVFSKLIGITPDYSTGDKVIAWGIFAYSIIYQFILAFLVVFIWNRISPWKIQWWSNYFFVTLLAVPATLAAITSVWFGIGGFVNLVQLFRDLKNRVVNPLDDGRVEGSMSLADKAQLEAVDEKTQAAAKK